MVVGVTWQAGTVKGGSVVEKGATNLDKLFRFFLLLQLLLLNHLADLLFPHLDCVTILWVDGGVSWLTLRINSASIMPFDDMLPIVNEYRESEVEVEKA